MFKIYTDYATNKINNQIAKGFTEALQVFCKDVETQLAAADAFLARDCWGNTQFHQIAEADSKSEVTEQLDALINKAKNLLDNNVDVNTVYLYFDRMNTEFPLYSPYTSFTEDEQDSLSELFKNLRKDDSIINTGWNYMDNGSNTYMTRIFRYDGGYSAVLFDLQRLTTKSQTYYKMSTPVVFINNNELRTRAHWTNLYQGELREQDFKQGYRILDCGGEEYIVVPKQIMTMTALYGVRYYYQWDWLNIVIYLFIAIFILSFAFAWLSLNISFFKPLKRLLSVMNSIRTGNLSARAEGPKDKEFSIINETFNSMLDTIGSLKIETYENQLRARNAEMNALRLQIRRHFFLNCLKNIYGMARSGNVKDIEKAVLLLSKHLRYTLNISVDAMDLQVELDMCRNYMELQGVGQERKPRLIINLDEKIRSFKVPPISILTLVENCCKYGVMQDKALEVTIDAFLRTFNDENYIYIMVKDNGPGFSEAVLQYLNYGTEIPDSGEHVGVSNVMTRIKMMYGDNCSMIFANGDGACIDIIIPVKEDEYEIIDSR